MIKHPAANEQVVAAVFGRNEVIGEGWIRMLCALDSEGHLCDDSPCLLAQAFQNSIACYDGVSGT